MRKHSHSSRNRLAREGGSLGSQPGRNPRGAKNKEMKPASSNMPSDWYPEKSRAAATKERKHTKQMASIPRGQRFRKSSKDAAIPIQHSALKVPGPLDHQTRVGAYH